MRKYWLLLIPFLLAIGYCNGPRPSKPVYATQMPVLPDDPTDLEQYVAALDHPHHIKPDNEGRIIWFDSLRRPTEYSIVYLHGFSASQFEGAPTHTHIARDFGANLYLPRLSEHGIDTSDALVNLTSDSYWESAKQALALGRKLGKKTILMGTSTGGTNALQLAAAYPDQVEALVLLSPNIAINDRNAWLLNDPWGLQIARTVLGSDYRSSSDQRPQYQQYWNARYRLEAAVNLEEMLETTMTPETFAKVKQPVLLLYYYRDEAHQDDVVKVSAMRDMFRQLGTPAGLKEETAMPLTGNHVIASPFKSKDAEGVEKEIARFLEQTVKMPRYY